MTVSADEVAHHIDATNPHRPGGSRDAWGAMPHDFYSLIWKKIRVGLDDLPDYTVASKRDVARYARFAEKSGKPFPAVVLTVVNGDVGIDDGAHRIAAARLLGHTEIDAYVGVRLPE